MLGDRVEAKFDPLGHQAKSGCAALLKSIYHRWPTEKAVGSTGRFQVASGCGCSGTCPLQMHQTPSKSEGKAEEGEPYALDRDRHGKACDARQEKL